VARCPACIRVDLLAQVLAGLIERNRAWNRARVDDVLVAAWARPARQSATPGRMAWLSAGFPAHVPSVTIERKCGSGSRPWTSRVQGITAGAYDIVIAAGVESMSRVPMARRGWAPTRSVPASEPGTGDLVPQGVSAELVAEKFALTREALDAYSAQSHARAARGP